MLFANAQSVTDKMKALAEAYGASLPGKLHELEEMARALAGGGPFEEIREPLEAVRNHAHKIAGTAGTFGFQSITDSTRAIEESLRSFIESERQLSAEQAAEIEGQIGALKNAAKLDAGAHTNTPFGATDSAGAAAEFVVLLAPPGEATDLLAREIEESGYRVQRVSGHVEKANGIGQGRAHAILVHTALPDGSKICRKLNEIFRREYRTGVPVIVLSDTGDYQARLQAVRSGANAFIVAPLDARSIVRKIRELADSPMFAPHRVLIVEDDDMLALQCNGAFEGPGFASRVVKDPSALLDRLETFNSELIVMDLSVAGASGLDLAKVVWQHDDFRDVAILFLTPGPEFNVQLLQLGLSDEFFIPRPIDIHALRSVATRYLADLRCGRRAPNFGDLYAQLDRISGMQPSSGEAAAKDDGRHSAPSEPEVAPETLPKVLVVDDDRHLVDAIAIKLSAHGIEVLKAYSGEHGFRVAWEEHPDAIVTDYEMPDGSGDYLVGRLKTAEETRNIPVMVLTAHTLDGRKDYALEREFVGRLGAVSYLAKPISLDALVAEVGRVVALPSSAAP
ncbi:MAG: response regulator [Alphaproteobacteria bacterium]|nr:response regulator [Alphaproteobacteria bacterium]